MSDTAIHLHVHTGDRGPDTPPAIRDLTPGDPDAYPRDLDDLHARLIRWFEESELARQDEINLAQRDREYFDGMQWTRDELKLLKERGQPAIVINKVADKVQLLCGMERKARTDPKAFARTPAEEDRADAATQALRYIADDNDFSIVRSEVFSNMLIEGAGGADLGLEDDGQGSCNITVTTIPWDRIWYDPHSRSYDFSDARYKGMVIWTDRDALEEMYPGEDVQDVIESSFSSTDFYYNDRKPRSGPTITGGVCASYSATGPSVGRGGARPTPRAGCWPPRSAASSRTARASRAVGCCCKAHT
jgi:hypothetical protein